MHSEKWSKILIAFKNTLFGKTTSSAVFDRFDLALCIHCAAVACTFPFEVSSTPLSGVEICGKQFKNKSMLLTYQTKELHSTENIINNNNNAQICTHQCLVKSINKKKLNNINR